MIETNSKVFFVHKKELPQLIEFAKTFKAKLSLVEISQSATKYTLSAEQLVNQFCNQNYKPKPINYKLVEVLYPVDKEKKLKTRSQMIQNANRIKKYIRSKLMKKCKVSLQEVRSEFKELNLTSACLSNHFSQVRRDLIKKGYKINTIKKGVYKLGQ